MRVTTFKMERTFVLGGGGKNHFPYEKATFGLEYSLEGEETLEDAEAKAAEAIYALGDRERRRRWGYLESLANQARQREKAKAEQQPIAIQAARPEDLREESVSGAKTA